jgi:PKD repeat protein
MTIEIQYLYDTLRPNAPGDLTQFAIYPSGIEDANWKCVDDVTTDNAATMVQNTGSGVDAYDLYALPTHTQGTDYFITQIELFGRGLWAGGDCYLLLKTGGTIYEYAATGTPEPSGMQEHTETIALNPKTGVGWTKADIDDLQIGFRSHNVQQLVVATYLTQIYVRVKSWKYTAEFAASAVKIAVDSPITFESGAWGGVEPYSYLWDFGDLETSTEANPVHTYHVPGFYTVTFTVTDHENEEQVEEKVDYIWITPNNIMVPLVDESDVTPSATSAWTDVLVSSLVDSNATGVLVHIINEDAAEQTWGVRQNGHTSNYTGVIAAGAQTWAMAGLDGSLKFEVYITSTNVKILAYGYTMFGVDFISPVTKAISGGWTDIDCSANTNSLVNGLVFIVKNAGIDDPITDNTQAYGLRPHGGTDSFTLGSPGYVMLAPGQMHFVTVGCDTAQICEFQTTNTTDMKLYLIGYVFDGFTFPLASVSVTPDPLALYVECDTSDIDHSSGWVQVQVNCEDNANRYASIRYPEDTIDDYKPVQFGGWKWQRVSADHIFEGKRQNYDVYFFVSGTCHEAVYALVTLNGTVKIGAAPVPNAIVFCFNATRDIFVGHTETDEDGQYTFIDAGYQFEEFLVSAHCIDSQLRRYGECKQITLLDIT